MTHKHFASGSSTFNCEICLRRTRMTTQDDTRFCGECYELLTIQNGFWTDGSTWPDDEMARVRAIRDKIVVKIKKLKGDVEAVKAVMPVLFKL